MKVWTVVNQKGGVGKTTSAVSLAGSLSQMGHKVLLLDLDPQASLTQYLGVNADDQAYTIYDLFIASEHPNNLATVLNKAVISTSISNIDLLPSHMALATLDKTLAQTSGKGLIVKTILQQLESEYDYAIIDCQPVLGVLMVNALVAAQHVILPTQTEHLSILGLQRMLETIEQLSPNLADDLPVTIVPSMFDRRLRACIGSFHRLRRDFSDQVWRGYIPIDTKFREASSVGLPINLLSAKAKGTFAYDKLTMDLVNYA